MIFNLRADPYQTDVTFIFDETPARIDDYFRRVHKASDELLTSIRENLNPGPKTQGRTLHLDNGAVIVWLRNIPMGAATMALLAHEAYHATCYILRRVGMEDGQHTEEAWAYLQQHLLEQAFRKVGDRYWK